MPLERLLEMYNGVINVFKERGFTSNDVVQIVKRLTKSKAGHTGTLDPQATGVLPICVGKATKIADYIMGGEKEYIARVVLGAETDTGDAHGNVIAKCSKEISREDVMAVLPDFMGKIVQVPPMYSAIKVRGKKLYEYARAGTEVARKERAVEIFALDVLTWDMPLGFVIRVGCSKGTYIRTLCADLGRALGTAAHMGSLIRTRSSNFLARNSISLAQLKNANLADVIMPIDKALEGLPKITICEGGHKLLVNGNKIPLEFVEGLGASPLPHLAFDHEGNLSGIFCANKEGFLRPLTMLL